MRRARTVARWPRGAQAPEGSRVGGCEGPPIRRSGSGGACQNVGRLPKGWQEKRSGGAVDAELLHAGLECRSLEAEDPGGAARSADAPAGIVEDRDNVSALDVFEALSVLRRPPAGRRRHEIAEFEAAPGREDD